MKGWYSNMALKISEELKKTLDPEVVKALEAVSKDSDILIGVAANYITKSRFDEVNTQLSEQKQANETLDKDLKSALKGAKSQEELTAKINELTEANEKTKTEYETRIAEREKSYQVDSALIGAKAKNTRAVKGLLNLESVTIKEGKVVGLEEQLSALKKSDPYLFEEEKPSGPKVDQFGQPIGGQPGGGKTTSEEVASIVEEMGFHVPKEN